jgi:hypothetical protein
MSPPDTDMRSFKVSCEREREREQRKSRKEGKKEGRKEDRWEEGEKMGKRRKEGRCGKEGREEDGGGRK